MCPVQMELGSVGERGTLLHPMVRLGAALAPRGAQTPEWGQAMELTLGREMGIFPHTSTSRNVIY